MAALPLPYYYGYEAEQFSFYRIPKRLFEDDRFRGVSTDAKLLYGLLLDRMALSMKNGWLDKQGRVFIYYPADEIMLVIAYGIIKIIGYCSNDLYCLAFQYDLACGIFLIVLGVIMLCSSTKLIPYLSVGLGALVLLDSLLTIQTSKDAKQFGLQTWHIILVTSIIAAVFGVLLIVRPFHSQRIAHVVAGGALLAEGLKSHCVVRLTVRIMKRKPSQDGVISNHSVKN